MTQRQTLRHPEDFEDKKAIFSCVVATPVTQVEVCIIMHPPTEFFIDSNPIEG